MVETSPAGPGDPVIPRAFEQAADAFALPPRAAPAPRNGSHGGLADLDPWIRAGRTAPREASQSSVASLWPWGLQGLAETLEVVALALLMFVLVRGVAQNFVVDGGSMEPNFRNGEMLIVNKLAYSAFDLGWLPIIGSDEWRPFGEPGVGDVIVFRFPHSPDRDFIKRIVALPGETVEVRDQQVIVDGVVLEEPYLLDLPAYRFGPETVPAGNVFVLGDARNNSYDSHSWGMLDQDLIIGRAELRYWPVARAGTVGHEEPVPLSPVGVTQSR
jgi:signal peptidase I